MPIFHRLLLAFLAVGAIVSVPLIAVSLEFSRDSARLRTEQSIRQQIALVAAAFDQEYGVGLQRALRQLTSSEVLAQYLSASQDERLVNARALEAGFQKFQADDDTYSGMYYVDAHGQIVAAVQDGRRINRFGQQASGGGAAAGEPTPRARESLFQRIRTTPSLLSAGNMEWFMPPREIALEGPVVDEQGRWALLAGLPVLDYDNGAFSGAVIVRVRLDRFLQRLQSVSLFDEQPLWVFAADGRALMQPAKPLLTLTPDDFPAGEAVAGQTLLRTDRRGLVAWRELAVVPGKPTLRLAYGVPEALLTKDFESAFTFFLVVLGLSAVGVLTLAWAVAQRLSAPIIGLAQAASRLAAGDLAQRVTVRSSGELSVLVDSFNRMAENLQLANQNRANAFAVLRRTAAQMQTSPEPLAAGAKDDTQDLRAISELINQLLAEREDNLSNIREAKDAAEQANRAKSQFLANMSHEIRTPLNAVLGMLRLLQSTSLTQRQADYVGKTEGAARSLLLLLNDILDFSKIEADKMALDPKPFRMDQVLRDLSTILSASVGTKPVEVLFDIDPALPRWLVGDDLRLRQVLINLGGNAIKFTDRGEVVITVRVLERTSDHAHVAFAVRDTGIGITAQQRSQIFSGFTQAEASTTRRFGGSGLGLAICQRLLGLMGSSIEVDSEWGVGSTFRFDVRLLVEDDPAEPAANRVDHPTATVNPAGSPAEGAVHPSEPPAATAAAGLAAMSALEVLVIDDNPTAREVLQAMITSLGWQADLAEDGEQGLALARRRVVQEGRPYDAIFVDWQMPGLDGWQTMRRLHEAGASPVGSLVMMVTAHGREMLSGRSPAEQAALGGFLVKPLTASMLFDAVADARLGRVASAGQAEADQTEPAPRPLEGLRLLVVEDNANNRQVAQELLESQGARVDLADNGRDGVAAVQSADPPFDAVLMDLQMPVMDGYTATRQLRAEPRWAALPIVAMTANAMSSDRQECLAAGMNDHIGKPFELDDLVKVLCRLTGRAPAPHGARSAAVPAPLEPETRQLAQAMGIQIEPALERMGGNVPVYGRMLRTFLADLPGSLSRLREQVDAGDWASLAIGMHTLKGLAGMLGAAELARAASELERAGQAAPPASDRGGHGGDVVNDGWGTLDDREAWNERIDAVQAAAEPLQQQGTDLVARLLTRKPTDDERRAAAALQDAAAAVAVAAASPGRTPAAVDSVQAVTVSQAGGQDGWLAELAARLEASDMQAVAWMDRIRLEGLPSLQTADLEALGEAVDRLEFERALGLCRALMASEVS